MTVLLEDVVSAAQRLKGQAHQTPILTSRTLNREVGAEVFLKCENFQRVGAFKFRGAYNMMSQLSTEEKARGVLTFSSGNHAQAVALVGRLLGIRVRAVMPKDAPEIKQRATLGYGAEIVRYDPLETTREELARGLLSERGEILAPPFDHPHVVAGQGTAALEMLDELPHAPDLVLAPCGGGGLLSGTAVAVKGRQKAALVVGVEPAVADDATRSFKTGRLQTVHNPPTIADGTRTPSLGKITFPLVQALVDDMVTVTEEAIVEAVRFLFFRMKLVVEPSGALGVAALLSGVTPSRGRVGVILSGGNIDGPTMSRILSENPWP